MVQSDKNEILSIVKSYIDDKFRESDRNRDMDLRERIVRVEEELKHQHKTLELMMAHSEERFKAMDERFTAMTEHSNERFRSVDQRFDDMRHYMDRRFNVQTVFLSAIFISLIGSALTIITRLG